MTWFDPTAWARSLTPYEDTLAQCGQAALGGGEATAWPPSWGGNDPLIVVPGELRFYARRMTAWQRNLMQAAAKKQAIGTAVQAKAASAIPSLGWYAPFLQRREAISDNTRVEVDVKPAGAPAWCGPWLIAEDRSGDEFDFGEMLADPQTPIGQHRVTGAVHHGGKVIASCPRFVPLTRGTFWIELRGTTVRMGYNGDTTAEITVPASMVKPYLLCLSMNVVGSTPRTPDPLLMQVFDVRVTTL